MATATKTKGEMTRDRILDIAETGILAKGFTNTSIDEIIAEAELTKSGFFYHFRDKTELARALLQRYLVKDDEFLDEIFSRGRELSDDPLHAYLVGLKIFAEMMSDLPNAHPGCIVATVAYQDKQFNDEIRALNREGVSRWRARFLASLEEIAETYPPRIDTDLVALADMLTVAIEGGIILSRVFDDPQLLSDQILNYRSHVRCVFLGS